MGNRGAQICYNCFGRSKPDKDEVIVVGRSEPPDPEPLSSEDQQHLSHLSSCFAQLQALVTSPASADPQLELIVQKDNCEVFGKDTERGFFLRSEWKIPVPAEALIKFLGNLERRKTWDKNLESLRCLRMLTPDTGLFYQTYKKVFMMSQRDLLIVSRAFRVGEAWVDLSSSITLTEFPETKDVVRMKLFMGGYYAEPIVPVGDLITKVTCISDCDFGGAVPKAVVKKISAITIPSFIKDVLAAMSQGP